MVEQNIDKLKLKIAHAASELGFDICRITAANLPQGKIENLKNYIAGNYHGSMIWMEETLQRRGSPQTLWPQARSVIMLAMNYGPQSNPLDELPDKNSGQISIYARNRDYHDIIKGKLKILAGKLVSWHECEVKVFVDTAPVMEKPLAVAAGIGWQGKHTNLVSAQFGSWLFLGSIFTDAYLPPDIGESDHCGNCHSCLDICPTNAFIGPYRIDARRCVSYLTIENKGIIAHEFRKPIGNRIYGCDDCLAICPWNKFAKKANETKLHPREDLKQPDFKFLMHMDEPGFRKFFSGSPIKRIGRDRFLRNVLIAAANSGDKTLIDGLYIHLKDKNPLVRGAAIWALRMLADSDLVSRQRDIYLQIETDLQVLNEWNCDLKMKEIRDE